MIKMRLAVTALVGATTVIGIGAGSASAQTGTGRVWNPVPCPENYLCLYTQTRYEGDMFYTKPTKKHPYKCNEISAWEYVDVVKSYQNRTTYKVKFYSDYWKLIRTIPQRGKPGAFKLKSGLKGTIPYVCFVKP